MTMQGCCRQAHTQQQQAPAAAAPLLLLLAASISLSVCVCVSLCFALSLQTMFRPSAQCIIRERIAKGVFDVVVAPRGGTKTVVVVPKTKSEEWRGYAFAEQVSRVPALLCCRERHKRFAAPAAPAAETPSACNQPQCFCCVKQTETAGSRQTVKG